MKTANPFSERYGWWVTVACPSQLGVTVVWLGFSLPFPHLPCKFPAFQTRPSPVWLIDFKTAAEYKLLF